MENSFEVDVELYEEIVGDLIHSTMNSSPSSSTHDARELPPSQEPMPYSGNVETSLATTPRSALRTQLAGYPEEPRTVAVTQVLRVYHPIEKKECLAIVCMVSLSFRASYFFHPC